MYISEAAAASQVEATAIRFYEAEGVLPEPKRTSSGYRTYYPADIDLIEFVDHRRGNRRFALSRSAPSGARSSCVTQFE